jgi:hypothetical protein
VRVTHLGRTELLSGRPAEARMDLNCISFLA